MSIERLCNQIFTLNLLRGSALNLAVKRGERKRHVHVVHLDFGFDAIEMSERSFNVRSVFVRLLPKLTNFVARFLRRLKGMANENIFFEGKLSVSPYFLHHCEENYEARMLLVDILSLKTLDVYLFIIF